MSLLMQAYLGTYVRCVYMNVYLMIINNTSVRTVGIHGKTPEDKI